MTPAETRAYNAGVHAVLDIAAAAAEAIRDKPWKPSRVGAVGALEELATAGRGLLIDDGSDNCGSDATPPPKPTNGSSPSPRGLAARAIALSDTDGDGNFGLTDEEIVRPSRRILVEWLNGHIPMLASNWSRRAALLLESNLSGDRQ